MGEISDKRNWNRIQGLFVLLCDAILLLHVPGMHRAVLCVNSAYGGNDFSDLCGWICSGFPPLEFWRSGKSWHKENVGILICTVIYTAVSYVGDWFDRNLWITVGFAIYVVFLYVCVFWVYKIRRRIDDKIMNDNLALFKARQKDDELWKKVCYI